MLAALVVICPVLSDPSLSHTDSVRRKIMVLDLDETLIHSHHDGAISINTPLTPPDFIVRVSAIVTLLFAIGYNTSPHTFLYPLGQD